VSPNRGACATRGHVMLMHSPFCLSPPKGGSNLQLLFCVQWLKPAESSLSVEDFDEMTSAECGLPGSIFIIDSPDGGMAVYDVSRQDRFQPTAVNPIVFAARQLSATHNGGLRWPMLRTE
jgi:hypothetical protein